MGCKGYLLIYWIQKEYNKVIDDNRGQIYGLQQNICYNIYRGLVYWAKKGYFWYNGDGKDKGIPGRDICWLQGANINTLSKMITDYGEGRGIFGVTKDICWLQGADIWGTIEVGWHEASWPIMHSWPNVLCTLIMLVIMMTIMMRMRLALVITAKCVPEHTSCLSILVPHRISYTWKSTS